MDNWRSRGARYTLAVPFRAKPDQVNGMAGTIDSDSSSLILLESMAEGQTQFPLCSVNIKALSCSSRPNDMKSLISPLV